MSNVPMTRPEEAFGESMKRDISTHLPLWNWKMDGFYMQLERSSTPPTMAESHGLSRSRALIRTAIR